MPAQLNLQSQLLLKGENHHAYIELCNAFYAREVLRLSREIDTARIRKMLASLPYYIERAATHIIQGNCPIHLDGQNGCWLAKQRSRAPAIDTDKNTLFYKKNALPGLIIPLVVVNAGELKVKLDCLDEVSADKMHCNEHGWFNRSGQALNEQTAYLLKPGKVIMTAACCGHRWHQGTTGANAKVTPRLLSLREMLLASRINWQNLAKPL